MKKQYCKLKNHWAPEPEFYDEKKGYHGNRDWCKECTSEYHRDRNAAKKRLQKKLIEFWNEHHSDDQIPLPK